MGDKKLGVQLWCARSKGVSLDPSKVRPVRYGFRKPSGGIWTSTFTPDKEFCSEWIEWVCREGLKEWATGNCVLVEPDEDARIYTIDSAEDLEKLYEKYPVVFNGIRDVNWPLVCRDFDAIHLTSRGQWCTRYKTPKYGHSLNLYGWDAESTFWCRPKFKIRPLPKDLRCKLTCEE